MLVLYLAAAIASCFAADANLEIAEQEVSRFLRTNPRFAYLADDLRSEAALALVEAGDGRREPAYLRAAVRNAVSDYAAEQRGAASARTLGRRDDVPQERQLPADYIQADEKAEAQQAAADLLEEILEVCQDERERQIIAMRAGGHADAEIAASLNVSRSLVQASRKTIEERFITNRD